MVPLKTRKELVEELQQLVRDFEGLEESLKIKNLDYVNLKRELGNIRNELSREKRLSGELQERLNQSKAQNERLAASLENLKTKFAALKEKLETLIAPPNSFGIFLKANEDGTIDIISRGHKLKVNFDPSIKVSDLKVGQELVLNDASNVIEIRNYPQTGEEATVDEVSAENLPEDCLRVCVGMSDQKRVVRLSDHLKEQKIGIGDKVLLVGDIAITHLPREEVSDLYLEEVPDVDYLQIGGLGKQIEQIRDAVELPYLEKELFAEFAGLVPKFQATKGILLFGPPGCGKTLVAQAMARQLSTALKERTGRDSKAFFINVKGPELLDKYVGNTEKRIREIYANAKRTVKENEGCVVIVFIDEADSILRMRGLGISSDVESTIVPQFLAELDGVEGLKGVITVLASNRQDLLDPAVLRPGRIDVKVKINHPTKGEARDIFKVYLTDRLSAHFHPKYSGEHQYTDYYVPFSDQKGDEFTKNPVPEQKQILLNNPKDTADYFINQFIETIFFKNKTKEASVKIPKNGDVSIVDNRFIKVSYANGKEKMFYFSDFISGAVISNIVNSMLKKAIKEKSRGGESYLLIEQGREAIAEEFRAMAQSQAFHNPDDWAKIYGEGDGGKIIGIEPMYSDSSLIRSWRSAESASFAKHNQGETTKPGHYL